VTQTFIRFVCVVKMSLKLARNFVSLGTASLKRKCLPNFHKRFTSSAPTPQTAQQTATATTKPPRKVNRGTDFLLNHGGKVALVAFSVSAALIYTYYLSIQNRNKVEEDVEKNLIIEPYELQQLRYANNISKETYLDIIEYIKQQYQVSSLSSVQMTYRDFIQTIQTTQSNNNTTTSPLTSPSPLQSHPLTNGHLLDRMIYQHMITPSDNNVIMNGHEVEEDGKDWYDIPVPVDYLLILFSMTMEMDVVHRLEAYHSLLQSEAASTPITDGK